MCATSQYSTECSNGRRIKRWTAGRKSALVLEIIQGKTTMALASRQYDLTPNEAALEQALITRFGTLGKVKEPFLLRSDNGLVFTSRDYTRLVAGYGMKQEFITPHCPQQNGMVERVIRTLKEQCVHRHRFESLAHALRVISDWIGFYNRQRPHQALNMMTPDQAYAATLTT
ncbi:transposase [Xanthomonas campestris pv. badrii]|uniref:Transposase n=1 Tax=Xanthomonas campestris pv. badrii TaxID=149696 RepID=A0A7Z2VEI9_XANCA|nr:transposase [Xanthomonas campestris pv. badrii]